MYLLINWYKSLTTHVSSSLVESAQESDDEQSLDSSGEESGSIYSNDKSTESSNGSEGTPTEDEQGLDDDIEEVLPLTV